MRCMSAPAAFGSVRTFSGIAVSFLSAVRRLDPLRDLRVRIRALRELPPNHGEELHALDARPLIRVGRLERAAVGVLRVPAAGVEGAEGDAAAAARRVPLALPLGVGLAEAERQVLDEDAV